MNNRQDQDARAHRSQGFTLVEMMMSSGISMIVVAAVMTSYLWFVRTSGKCRQYCYAQNEVRVSTQYILSHVRNAQSVEDIDDAGEWVHLRMPDDTVCTFFYTNPLQQVGLGQLLFRKDVSDPASQTSLVVKGLSGIMTSEGYSKPILLQMMDQTNVLHIAFRVTEPYSPGSCPAEVDTGVRMRNN